MWNSNVDSSSNSQSVDWHPYADKENTIIEAAFKSGQNDVTLNNYLIDFRRNLQISNSNVNKQLSVKRMEYTEDKKQLREERFIPNPVAPTRPYGGLYGFISPFIKEVVKDLNLTREQLPSKDKKIVPLILEKAALGIIEEGKKIRMQSEAERLANILRTKKSAGIRAVWECCAKIYSIESFLYKRLNENMRLIGSDEHEQVWRSELCTLGPFCLLLWDNPSISRSTMPGTILYRGAYLSDDLITLFKDDYSKDPKPIRSFQAFTSCTRNRSVAEQFRSANVLFIMRVRIAFSANLSSLSEYPNEEEELLWPGVCFTIERMEFDNDTNKHLIFLTLQHRHASKSLYSLTEFLFCLTIVLGSRPEVEIFHSLDMTHLQKNRFFGKIRK